MLWPSSFQEPVCLLLGKAADPSGRKLALFSRTLALGGKWQLARWWTPGGSQTQLYRAAWGGDGGDNSEISWPCAYYLWLMTAGKPGPPVWLIFRFFLPVGLLCGGRFLHQGSSRDVNLICLLCAFLFLPWRAGTNSSCSSMSQGVRGGGVLVNVLEYFCENTCVKYSQYTSIFSIFVPQYRF